MTNNLEHFPRELTSQEKELLLTALPENKIGYKHYRDKIERMVVLGNGRFGGGNFILGPIDSELDLESKSTPIFAISKIVYDDHEIYVTIHHESEDQIEIDIQNFELTPKINEMKEIYRWTYSNWSPGQKAPYDNSAVREIHLILKSLVLVIASEHRKIWVYSAKDEVNYLIPVTNFYNELMLIMDERNPEVALNPNRLFIHLDEYSDEKLGQAFLLYNKYWNRIEVDYSLFDAKMVQRRKSFFDFLKK
ncbi:MAG: hypothetical protein A2279_12370 [Stygiobacter sp. RIFOXYA12_FULL_38_9]|nr:MAG: hypothetical protein A2X10_12695 [Bacteroidetes bacterium GWA2_33_15]OGU79946.1 MAG: hypothetical protein A2279_12370 [Stygiobacter sp. RIFOXYA12_FULL_38_9]OGV09562.1 MAG: hypothetical protein A2299_19400 [Stygiobacter sp. RIFOXYB2_FULL_37_11]OGV13912.1 MAG: hypothetical protein A2440_12215 [Stygiobacter sp. RIFOXYC2_FULL_38_25]OGV17214.1 MAG: hypothetical protein A2237_19210 [Stygiobacter sp. RIFOXYA2_FULL_38_8]OGV82642.1 MAG: hypothetical protein A2X65_19470 [Stygiobacter sp. GWF2_38